MVRDVKLLSGVEFDDLLDDLDDGFNEEEVKRILDIFHKHKVFAVLTDEQLAQWESTPDYICPDCDGLTKN